jgi:hypothetical protein
MKSDFAKTGKKMRRNLTRKHRLNTSRTKLSCKSFTHEIMIGERSEFDPRRYEIFENLYWRVTPIRERGMEMEVGFHSENLGNIFIVLARCKR